MLQSFFVTMVKQGRLWELEHAQMPDDEDQTAIAAVLDGVTPRGPREPQALHCAWFASLPHSLLTPGAGFANYPGRIVIERRSPDGYARSIRTVSVN